ncbi:MAG: hypothetical protein Ct9H90mP20_4940 [Candidatus Neomarinimicrobiota bacterium]|nr:MAG: hypothetical protein Ct9H90mP20_4940 [Candidatus Neomarinimicrobiota bacterium]
MSSNSTIQLTQAWKIQYNARFDFIEQNLVSHTFSIYRDLHCWEMSINWTPNGYAPGSYLRINVKSPSLSDLKFEQRGGTFTRPSLFDRWVMKSNNKKKLGCNWHIQWKCKMQRWQKNILIDNNIPAYIKRIFLEARII